MGFEHKFPDEQRPRDILVSRLKVLRELGIVDKLALKKSPTSAVEDVPPSREKPIKRMPHL